MNLFNIIAILIFVSFVVNTLKLISKEKLFSVRGGLTIVSSTFFLCGLLVFFAPIFYRSGHLSWISSGAEWPIGHASNVLVTKDGTYIVPHDSTGRVQIYNKDLDYIRGWFIDDNGGTFTLLPIGDTSFSVYVVRGRNNIEYDVYGNQLSLKRNVKRDSDVPKQGIDIDIPTPIYLLPFTSPFMASIFALFGGLIMYIRDKMHVYKA
ncbi:hypothetical protein L4D77_28855 [Photobacterium frigidiphilum]|uniref:hypothetical protein n=1 Tax=Photobacterium frigidiphilum TaxID=264736 RepID=UPI003D11AC00